MYFGEEANKNKRKILYRLKHNKIIADIYVLTLPEYGNNLMEIYKANTLLWPHYKKRNLNVIGIAKGNDEACELATTIIGDVYNKTKAFDLTSYFTA